MPTRATKSAAKNNRAHDPEHKETEHKEEAPRRRHAVLLIAARTGSGSGRREWIPSRPTRRRGCSKRMLRRLPRAWLRRRFRRRGQLRDADADVLCEPRGQEPVEEPAAGAGACEGASARADREDANEKTERRRAAEGADDCAVAQGGARAATVATGSSMISELSLRLSGHAFGPIPANDSRSESVWRSLPTASKTFLLRGAASKYSRLRAPTSPKNSNEPFPRRAVSGRTPATLRTIAGGGTREGASAVPGCHDAGQSPT